MFEGNYYKISRDYDNFSEQAKKSEVIENYKNMKAESEDIKKAMAEVSTLALTPKYDESVINQAKTKLEAVIGKLNDFRTRVLQYHVEDLKYQIGQHYDHATEMQQQAAK